MKAPIALLFCSLALSVHAQSQPPILEPEFCGENGVNALNDGLFVVDQGDFGWSTNPLDNDIIPSGWSVLGWEFSQFVQLPTCLEVRPETTPDGLETSVIQYIDTDSTCCGLFGGLYNVIFMLPGSEQQYYCQAKVDIEIVCPKSDCSTIVLESPEPVNGDEPPVPAECVYVCSDNMTTVMAPYSESNSYEWTVIGGTVSSSVQDSSMVEIEWGATGSGSIVASISSSNGTTEIIEQCIEIGQSPTALFDVPSTLVCLDTPVSFDGSPSQGASSYSWDFGDGSPLGNGVNVTHNYDLPGTYSVVLTVDAPLYNDQGELVCCCQDTYVMDIEVLDLPGPDIQCISTLCAGDTACYWTTACSPPNDPNAYQWEVTYADGSTEPFIGHEICVQWGDGPQGQLSLSLDSNYCPGYCPQPTFAQVPIISSESLIAGPEIVCPEQVVVYSVPKWMDVQYDWTVTGALSATPNGNQVTVVWGMNGTGTVEVNYESPFLAGLPHHTPPDCSGSGFLSVDILPEFKFTAEPNPVCINPDNPFSYTYSVNASNVAWSVSPNANLNPQGNGAASIEFLSAGTHVVTATLNNPGGYCNETVSSVVVVSEQPVPDIIGPTEGCAGVELLYSIGNVSPASNYYWNIVGGSFQGGNTWFNGVAPPLVTWNPGQVAQSLTVQSQSNSFPFCSASSSLTFVELMPSEASEVQFDGACANAQASYEIELAPQDNGETLEWSVIPSDAGSVVSGQGQTTAEIQWNNYSAPAQLMVVSSLCGTDVTKTFNVDVHNPSVDIVQIGPICPNNLYGPGVSPGIFEANPSSFVEYSWNGQAPTNDDWILAYDGTVEVVATDVNGCLANASFEAQLSPAPIANITSPDPSSYTTCNAAVEVDLITPTQNDWTHTWLSGSTPFDSGPGPTKGTVTIWSPGAPTTYTVKTVNAAGCMASDSYTIVVSTCPWNPGNPPPPPCVTSSTLSMTASPASPQCADVVVTTNAVVGGEEPVSVSVNYGNGESSGAAGPGNVANSTWSYDFPIHTYDEVGCYYVEALLLVPSDNDPTDICVVTADASVCVPVIADFSWEISNCGIVTFSDESAFVQDDPIVDWAWDFDQGSIYSGSTPNYQDFDYDLSSISPFQPVDVTLTVTTASGCQHSIPKTIPLEDVLNLSTSMPDVLCQGQSGEYEASSDNGVAYTWKWPDVSAEILGEEVEHTFAVVPANNPTEVKLTVENSTGCIATASEFILVVPEPQSLLVSSLSQLICPDLTTLEAESGFAEYTWYDENGTLLSQGPSPISPDVGPGTYSVTVKDLDGCEWTSDSIDVSLFPDMTPIISGETVICGEGDVTLSVPAIYEEYQWFHVVGGTNVAIWGATSHTYSQFGVPINTSDFIVRVRDSYGCFHDSPIHSVNWVKDVDFTLSGSPDPACAGDDVVLSVNSTDPNLTYYWSTGATGTSITVQNAGFYTVTGMNPSGCVQQKSFEVRPIPDLCTVPTGCHTSCFGDLIEAPTGHASYTWFYDDDPDVNPPGPMPIPNATGPSLSLNQSGVYFVSVTGTNGCTATSGPLEFVGINCFCDIEAIYSEFSTGLGSGGPFDEEFGQSYDCCISLDFDNQSANMDFIGVEVYSSSTGVTVLDGNFSGSTNSNPIMINAAYNAGQLPLGIVHAADICFNDPGQHAFSWKWYGTADGNPSDTLVCDGEFTVSCPGCSYDFAFEGAFDANLTRLEEDGCCHQICPELTSDADIDPNDLCLWIDWGDGGLLEYGDEFSACYTHCYDEGTGCDIASHEVRVYAMCCDDSDLFLEYYYDQMLFANVMFWTGCANCCPLPETIEEVDCYVRNAFWVKSMEPFEDDACLVTLGGTQFLGPDMIQHFSPLWWAPNTDGGFENNFDQYDNVKISAPPGAYSICRSVQGLASDGTECSTQTCHDIQVNCAEPCENDACPDLNDDGFVNTSDLLLFLSAFGDSC